MSKPFASVVVLNYQGEKLIERTLSSLVKMNYPIDRYEIIIVDNNSTDESGEIIQNFIQKNSGGPKIKLIRNTKNLGFSTGNNVGIRVAKGKYVALLNNDCIVERRWLSELVKVAEQDEHIFSVGSKVLFYPSYFSFSFGLSPHFSLRTLKLKQSELTSLSNRPLFLSFIQSEEKYFFEIPVLENDTKLSIEVAVEGKNTFRRRDIQFGKHIPQEFSIEKNRITFSTLAPKKRKKKVQNAGVIVFPNGYGRDRGAVVAHKQQNYENDNKQYSKEEVLFSTCGAAVLYRKSFFQRYGLLDERFFMYYEDVEISERALKKGYTNYYAPKAIVRHLHAHSSQEGSDFFAFHVERGRLLHVLLHFPGSVFLLEYLRFLLWSIYVFLHNFKNRRLSFMYFRVLLSVLRYVPTIFRERRSKKVFYKDLLSGKWFLKKAV